MITLLSLEMTLTRPELMRVVKDGSLYLVQALSTSNNDWLTLAVHSNEKLALIDCVNWY
jgi:hypothetical protein